MACSLAALALLGAGCGSDDDTDSDEGGGASASNGVETLKLAVPTVGGDLLNHVALERGFFEQEGVDVQISENTLANTGTLVAAGEVDIAQFGVSLPTVTSIQGKDVSILFALSGGGHGGSIFSDDEVATIEDLQAMDECRLGTLPPPSSSFGLTAQYKENLGLNCEIVPLPDSPAHVGGLLADRIDAFVGSYGSFLEAIDKNEIHPLIDSRDTAQREQYLPKPVAEVVVYGLKEKVEEKREAIKRYIRALLAAEEYLGDAPSEEVAESLKQNSLYDNLTPEAVKDGIVEGIRPYLLVGSEKGRISEAQWADSLEFQRLSDIEGFDPESERVQYAAMVDAAIYDEAVSESSGK